MKARRMVKRVNQLRQAGLDGLVISNHAKSRFEQSNISNGATIEHIVASSLKNFNKKQNDGSYVFSTNKWFVFIRESTVITIMHKGDFRRR
jgi:hypothetical protein